MKKDGRWSGKVRSTKSHERPRNNTNKACIPFLYLRAASCNFVDRHHFFLQPSRQRADSSASNSSRMVEALVNPIQM